MRTNVYYIRRRQHCFGLPLQRNENGDKRKMSEVNDSVVCEEKVQLDSQKKMKTMLDFRESQDKVFGMEHDGRLSDANCDKFQSLPAKKQLLPHSSDEIKISAHQNEMKILHPIDGNQPTVPTKENVLLYPEDKRRILPPLPEKMLPPSHESRLPSPANEKVVPHHTDNAVSNPKAQEKPPQSETKRILQDVLNFFRITSVIEPFRHGVNSLSGSTIFKEQKHCFDTKVSIANKENCPPPSLCCPPHTLTDNAQQDVGSSKEEVEKPCSSPQKEKNFNGNCQGVGKLHTNPEEGDVFRDEAISGSKNGVVNKGLVSKTKKGLSNLNINRNSVCSSVKIVRRSRREDDSNGRGIIVTYKNLKQFFQLAEDPVVDKFLNMDVCRRYADKYLLAMVFTYFVRAKLLPYQYSRQNFFAALYLAHDMEEDEEELKYEVFPWVLGEKWRKTYSTILQMRDNIFWAIDCRAVVSKKCCDQVIDMQPDHWFWARERPMYHGGARREHLKHPEDDGRPRGPNKSPLRCQKCLERDCEDSERSFLVYVSESEETCDDVHMEEAQTTTHSEKDSGYETFLCEQSNQSIQPPEPLTLEETECTDDIVKANLKDGPVHCCSSSEDSSAWDLSYEEEMEVAETEDHCEEQRMMTDSQADTQVLHSDAMALQEEC